VGFWSHNSSAGRGKANNERQLSDTRRNTRGANYQQFMHPRMFGRRQLEVTNGRQASMQASQGARKAGNITPFGNFEMWGGISVMRCLEYFYTFFAVKPQGKIGQDDENS